MSRDAREQMEEIDNKRETEAEKRCRIGERAFEAKTQTDCSNMRGEARAGDSPRALRREYWYHTKKYTMVGTYTCSNSATNVWH
jgi:hypothetical protein